ncbi:mitochondrial [Brachionus plicatilis]|uniref:Mitochondrial n=1 Tax=Brachionus plicatilis TaxID=10195 RepID=A0A3M7QL31_BRAPC|nr:mitochondrial [Brachionus plicatilis]
MNSCKLILKSLKSSGLAIPVRQFGVFSALRSNIFNVQDESDFKSRVLDNSKPVIVDFHAVWCGPCKILGPRLEKLMATYEGKADFAKVDIDQLSSIAEQYNISSVPTVMALKNGKKLGQFIGVLDEDRIKKFVKEAIEH